MKRPRSKIEEKILAKMRSTCRAMIRENLRQKPRSPDHPVLLDTAFWVILLHDLNKGVITNWNHIHDFGLGYGFMIASTLYTMGDDDPFFDPNGYDPITRNFRSDYDME
jgi:hypothetical protein